MKDQFDLENNLTTHATIRIRDNKDLSLKQAQKVIDDNRNVNSEIKKDSNETENRG